MEGSSLNEVSRSDSETLAMKILLSAFSFSHLDFQKGKSRKKRNSWYTFDSLKSWDGKALPTAAAPTLRFLRAEKRNHVRYMR